MQLGDNARGILLMNLAMAMFTLNDTAMKAVLETMPLMQAVGLRGVMTTGALALLAWHMGALARRPGPRDRSLLIWRTLGEVTSTVTFLAALAHMEIANLSAIMQALPLAITLAAAVFLGDRIGWRRLVAILIGLVGVLIIIRPGPDGFDRWSLLGLVSVGFVVLRDLTTRQLDRGIPSVLVALLAAVAVAAVGLAGATLEGWQPFTLREAGLLVLAGSALIIGYLTVVATMRVGDIGLVAPFRYMALLWAIFLGWLAFGQLPDAATLTGAALVVGSGVFTLLRSRRVARAEPGAETGAAPPAADPPAR